MESDFKKWYQSETIQAQGGVIVIAVITFIEAVVGKEILPAQAKSALLGILAAFGIHGRVNAKTKIG